MTAPQCPGAPSRLHRGVMRACTTDCARYAWAADGIEPAMQHVDGQWQCENRLPIADDVAGRERAA